MDLKKNDSRMRQGLDIYCYAMRRYITKQMQDQVEGDWFRDRVMGVLYRRWDEIEEALKEGKGKEEVLEFKDFHEVIRQNRKVFPPDLAGGRRRKSIAVTWMQEITEWRNTQDHEKRGMDDFTDQDADRALDTCARVLSRVDPEAEKQVRKLFDDPQEVRRQLKDERAEHEETKKVAAKTEGFEKQFKGEQEAHERTKQGLRKAKKLKSLAEKGKQKTDQDLRKVKDEHKTTKQKLEAEQAKHRETKKELKEVTGGLTSARKENSELQEIKQKLAAAQSQPPSKPASVPAQEEVDAYRKNNFKPAKSRNGWTYQTIKDKWFVTRWVGQALGQYRACVFAPSQKFSNEWVRATEEPLIDRPCNSEEEAFEHLWRAEQSDEINRLAREAIKNYMDLYSEDDIPFRTLDETKPCLFPCLDEVWRTTGGRIWPWWVAWPWQWRF